MAVVALKDELERVRADVEAFLAQRLPAAHSGGAGGDASRLHEALRYAALGGGKRIRPALCLFSAEALGGQRSQALPAAAALELIHVYSLVHDDLPAMDDDDLRRGRPTCHKAYSDWMAILVGDGLQTLAFEILTDPGVYAPLTTATLVRLLAQAAGWAGMVGGQALDMAAETDPTLVPHELAALEQLHRQKTGALLRASALLGATVAGVEADDPRWGALDGYAQALGLAFQVTDDVLDCTQSTEQLGKTAGKDRESDKLTYVKLLGLEGARAKAQGLRDEGLARLSELGAGTELLAALLEHVVARSS